jgi:lipopolysaccharide export system protein LptC
MAGSDHLTMDTAAERRARFGERPGRIIESRDARRSRFVGLMKVVLPLAAVALAGVVIAWPQFVKKAGFMITVANMEVEDGGVAMHNARYRGTDRHGQPFYVTAEAATQQADSDKQVLLDKVMADISRSGGEWFNVSADSGVFNPKANQLLLLGNVGVYSDRGYELHGNSAELDIKAGMVTSDEKVWGHGPLGSIRAGNMQVFDKGQRVVFGGRVTTVLTPPKGGAG